MQWQQHCEYIFNTHTHTHTHTHNMYDSKHRGLKPKRVVTGAVSKQELAEVCRRQSVEEKEEEGQEERIKGLGYMRYTSNTQ